jgi:hypothetical protein
MSDDGPRLAVRESTLRQVFSYLLLGICTFSPLLLGYIPVVGELFRSTVALLEFSLAGAQITVYFDARLIPLFLSSAIGAGGGFLIWCYYTRTRCLEEQVPGSTLLGKRLS